MNKFTEAKKSTHKTSQTPTEKLKTKLFDFIPSETVNKPVTQKHSSPIVESQSHAHRTIQKWNEKLLKQTQSKLLLVYFMFKFYLFININILYYRFQFYLLYYEYILIN